MLWRWLFMVTGNCYRGSLLSSSIWKERNDRIFKRSCSSSEAILSAVVLVQTSDLRPNKPTPQRGLLESKRGFKHQGTFKTMINTITDENSRKRNLINLKHESTMRLVHHHHHHHHPDPPHPFFFYDNQFILILRSRVDPFYYLGNQTF